MTNIKKQPISYTVTVSYTNRTETVYTSLTKEDAQRFKNYYKKGKILQPSGSVVSGTVMKPNFSPSN